jgi:lipopolysaccharide biosynthesis protein
MNTKRLFLFAGYNKSGFIDDALVFYVQNLSKFGDIVLCMDSDTPDSEMEKVRKYCVHTVGARHGEYDFGSYKRAYIWATENLNLSDYNFLYLVNDSVYGPLFDMNSYFDLMEFANLDAFGIVKNPHRGHPHIQSWFVGLRPSVFMTDWLDLFMHTITKLESKGLITREYEQGLTKRVIQNNLNWGCLYSTRGRSVYNKIKKLYRAKMPFMKRVAFNRNHGAFGKQILYVLQHIPATTRDAILSSARRVYGEKHVDWLLTRNPLRILYRRIYHAIYKLFIEGV